MIALTPNVLASFTMPRRRFRSVGTAQRTGSSILRYPSTSGSMNGSSHRSSEGSRNTASAGEVSTIFFTIGICRLQHCAGSHLLPHSKKQQLERTGTVFQHSAWKHITSKPNYSGVGSISWLVRRGRGRVTMCELYAKIIAESELLQLALNEIHKFCFQHWSRGRGTCRTGSGAPELTLLH